MEKMTLIGDILLLVIPLAAALWASIEKIKAKRLVDALLITVFVVLFSIDILSVSLQLYQDVMVVPEWVNIAALISGVLLLPVAFLYFAIQVRHGWKNWAIYVVLSTVIIVLFSNVAVFIGEPGAPEELSSISHYFFLVKDGSTVFSCNLSDIVLMIQAVLISARIIIFGFFLRKMELTFSKDMRVFFVLAFACVIFTCATYFIPWSFWMANRWLFIGGVVLLVTLQFVQIARNRDLAPLVTKGDSEPVELQEYIKINNSLAARARDILDVQKRYLLPGLVIDDMVTELGTNRTYFTRMMRIEFGQSFNEYVNNCRLKYSQDLLVNSDKSISDIAEESGFGSSSTYCRVFKRLTDTTPEAWREKYKK